MPNKIYELNGVSHISYGVLRVEDIPYWSNLLKVASSLHVVEDSNFEAGFFEALFRENRTLRSFTLGSSNHSGSIRAFIGDEPLEAFCTTREIVDVVDGFRNWIAYGTNTGVVVSCDAIERIATRRAKFGYTTKLGTVIFRDYNYGSPYNIIMKMPSNYREAFRYFITENPIAREFRFETGQIISPMDNVERTNYICERKNRGDELRTSTCALQ